MTHTFMLLNTINSSQTERLHIKAEIKEISAELLNEEEKVIGFALVFVGA